MSKTIVMEAVARRCSVKAVFLEILQNSQEKTSARVSFLIKFQDSACNFIKKRLWHRRFPMNFEKFLRRIGKEGYPVKFFFQRTS